MKRTYSYDAAAGELREQTGDLVLEIGIQARIAGATIIDFMEPGELTIISDHAENLHALFEMWSPVVRGWWTPAAIARAETERVMVRWLGFGLRAAGAKSGPPRLVGWGSRFWERSE